MVIALIVGAISVANTMAMSIMERQGELACCAPSAGRRSRVAWLIFGEGVAVSVLGAAAGLLLGVIGARLLVDALGVSAYVSPSVTAWGLGRGLLVGVAIGVLGGHLPRLEGHPHDAVEGPVRNVGPHARGLGSSRISM